MWPGSQPASAGGTLRLAGGHAEAREDVKLCVSADCVRGHAVKRGFVVLPAMGQGGGEHSVVVALTQVRERKCTRARQHAHKHTGTETTPHSTHAHTNPHIAMHAHTKPTQKNTHAAHAQKLAQTNTHATHASTHTHKHTRVCTLTNKDTHS